MKDDVLCGDETKWSGQFKRIFRSAAFKTFLVEHTNVEGCVATRTETHGGMGIHATEDIAAGIILLPYTGVFVSSDIGDLSSHKAMDADRDMLVDWCIFDGKTGRKREENSGVIRGWGRVGKGTRLGSMANHRCLRPNAAFEVVDLYVFFQAPEDDPWIIYASEDDRKHRVFGRLINNKGVMQRHAKKKMPPIIPNSTHGDVFLISWPIIRTWGDVRAGECITVDYGDNYVAISPHHTLGKVYDEDGDASKTYVAKIAQRWEDAMHGALSFCECDDCLKIKDNAKRSVFLPP
jgi:hypothetical protein